MKLTEFGKKVYLLITLITVFVGIPLLWFCPIVSIIMFMIYVAFIVFNIILNRHCIKLIEKNNKAVEDFAKANGYETKSVSPEEYNRIMKNGSGNLGDDILINKDEVKFI